MENITNPKETNNDIINVRELVFKYLRKWHWFVISGIVFLSLAVLYLSSTVPQYQVQSSIILRQEEGNTSNIAEMALMQSLGMSGTSKEVEDEIQILTSKTIISNVITELGLSIECFEKNGLRYEDTYPKYPVEIITPANFNDQIKATVELKISPSNEGYSVKFEWGNTKEKFQLKTLNEPFKTAVGILSLRPGLNFNKEKTYKVKIHPIRNLAEIYGKKISVTPVNKKSNAINISTSAENVDKAKDIINKLVELYNLDAVIDKNIIASNTKEFVEERLKLIKEELLEVELNVETYKKNNNLTDIASEAELFLESSSEYNKKLAEIETQINLISYIESYVKDGKNQYSLVPANLGVEDQSLIEQMKSYNEALLERMKLLRSSNTDNPVITQLEQQIRTLRTSIITSINSVKDGLKISKRDVLGKESQFTSKIKQVPTQEREFIEIKRQQEIKQNLYLFLLQKREENALTLASAVPSAKTIDKAYSSIEPVAPRRMIIIAVALILAIIFPIVIIFFLDMFNNKINNKKELLKLVKVPYLGSIGINKEEERVVVKEGRTTPIVEMFRMVRTNIQFMLGGKVSPVILVTSSIGGEGKSFTAINVASSFALMNKKVVLIGLDIRKPMLGEYLHFSKTSGITLYLSDPTYQTNDIIFKSEIHPNLDVIPAGPIPPNPAELLMSERLDNLIHELKKTYDYIIIDSAPIGLISDTYLLNRFVDNTVYVSRQNYTPRDMTDMINDIHVHNKLHNMGIVLNGVKEGMGYGYGYGYGNIES